MEYSFQVLTDEEIQKLSQEDFQAHLDSLRKVKHTIEVMESSFVSKLIFPLVCQYDIQEIGIDPHHEYDDEGFTGSNMITIDGDDVSYKDDEYVPKLDSKAKKISYAQLQIDIDDILSTIPQLGEYQSLNISELRSKYNYTIPTYPTPETYESKSIKKLSKSKFNLN